MVVVIKNCAIQAYLSDMSQLLQFPVLLQVSQIPPPALALRQLAEAVPQDLLVPWTFQQMVSLPVTLLRTLARCQLQERIPAVLYSVIQTLKHQVTTLSELLPCIPATLITLAAPGIHKSGRARFSGAQKLAIQSLLSRARLTVYLLPLLPCALRL